MDRAGTVSDDKCFNRFLWLFVLSYYVLVWSNFGLKFACAFSISMLTGLFLSFFSKKDKQFGWQLFLLFPMFYSLALPLWVIPPVLLLAYLVSCSAFGGYEKRIFCPVVVAVVVAFCGYSYTAAFNASRPMETGKAFLVYSSGMPAFKPVWKIYQTMPQSEAIKASIAGKCPSVLGAYRGGILLVASFLFAFVFKRKLVWLFSNCMFVAIFSTFFSKLGLNQSFYPLIFGLVPLLLFVGICDNKSLENNKTEEFVSAFVFSVFAIMFTFKTENPFLPVFSYLLMQILTPLILDIINALKPHREKNGEKNGKQ